MPVDVRLESLEFKSTYFGNLTSVKCNLSHGRSSNVFQNDGQHVNPQTINFAHDKPVRMVSACSICDSILNLVFYCVDGNETASYNPTNYPKDKPFKEHKLADNEDIIGVYGYQDKKKGTLFSSFGLIVRVR